jgi:hypothetical protein
MRRSKRMLRIMRGTLRSTLLREILTALIIIMAIGSVLSIEIAF